MEHPPQDCDDVPPDEAAVSAEWHARIAEGVEAAQRQGRRIDDLTAKRIGRLLDPGMGAIHDFVETGGIAPDMPRDLEVAEEVAADLGTEESSMPWIAALREYLAGRLIRSELPGWNGPSMD